MLLELNKKFIAADKKELSDQKTMGQALADCLASQKSVHVSAIKAWGWAIKLYENSPLNLDNADCLSLEKFVADSTLSPFAHAQILQELNTAKDEEKNKEK